MNIGSPMTSRQAMELAISRGKLGAGFVSPNPLVGCVILDQQSRLLAAGYHARLGGAHAEIAALEAVGDRSLLAGATVYVTLEPCAHHGRTPPCAEALAKLPIHRVIYGIDDPNPLVSGRGVAILRAAGKVVERYTELQSELDELAEIFLFNQKTKRAFFALKVASTLDGQVALKSGESQWITGAEARDNAHYVRGCYDAVMIGRGTFESDNPALNSRRPEFAGRANSVLVLDPLAKSLDKAAHSKLLSVRGGDKVIWVVSGEASVASSEIRTWTIPYARESGFDLVKLAERCAAEGIFSVLIEGGPFLISRCLEQKAAQRWYQYLAPTLLGGGGGISATSGLALLQLAERIDLKDFRWSQLGSDLFVTGRLAGR